MKIKQVEGLHEAKEEPTVDLFKKKSSKAEIKTETDSINLEKTQKIKKKHLDPNRNDFLAPFDLFGVSAKFYIDGRNQTLTWIGCVCSTLLVGLISVLFVLQVTWHVNKTESIVTTFDTDLEGNELFDLHAAKQTLALQYFHLFYEKTAWRTFVDFEFYHVSKNLRTGSTQETLLPSIPCEDTEFYKNDKNLKETSLCVEFDKKTEIGQKIEKN